MDEYRSPRDMDGHGTHMASTAASGQVTNVAALGGFGKGTASGGLIWPALPYTKPVGRSLGNQNMKIQRQRIPRETTRVEVVVAAMDDAIADGVDILSMSIGNSMYSPYENDTIGMAKLHIAKHNILVDSFTLYNLSEEMYPLVYAGDVGVLGVPQALAGASKGIEVKRAGAVGFIVVYSPDYGNELKCNVHVLLETFVTYDDGTKILEYITSTKNPMAMISPATTVLHYKPAPFMAKFTSRGPNEFLAHDLLEGWSDASSPTYFPDDHRSVKYNIVSGTSMSCPHVSGASALLRAIHPDWSIAAIKSALMTTTWITNNLDWTITDGASNIATPFQFGAGHFQPIKAADPGLNYDSSYDDYLFYLCSAGPKAPKRTDHPTFECLDDPPLSVNLNYPPFVIPNLNSTITILRTVTNVGRRKSTYLFRVKSPPGFRVKASTSTLKFDQIGQKQSFQIIVSPINDPKARKSEYGFGWYTRMMDNIK
ncbi:hypothetical protein REPUB_Repub14bG0104800 [Reevesia pubescens]